MNNQRLAEILDGFAKTSVVVVGDFYVDRYLYVDRHREISSLETGLPAHQVVRVQDSPGAAGNVSKNLAALGVGSIHCVGAIGRDAMGEILLQRLAEIGCQLQHLYQTEERRTPTYMKACYCDVEGLDGEFCRFDLINVEPLSPCVQNLLINGLQGLMQSVDAVIVLDQVASAGCGLVTHEVRRSLCDAASMHSDTLFWIDSRNSVRAFPGMHAKPNEFEATGAPIGSDVKHDDLAEAVLDIRRICGKPVFATAGNRGIMISDPTPKMIPTVVVDPPLDSTGAGDSVTAAAVLALCSGTTIAEAAAIGNLAAAVTLKKLGTTGTACKHELSIAFSRSL